MVHLCQCWDHLNQSYREKGQLLIRFVVILIGEVTSKIISSHHFIGKLITITKFKSAVKMLSTHYFSIVTIFLNDKDLAWISQLSCVESTFTVTMLKLHCIICIVHMSITKFISDYDIMVLPFSAIPSWYLTFSSKPLCFLSTFSSLFWELPPFLCINVYY